MPRGSYDIFISYRKIVSGDKPELLWQILEHSGYKSRVSFDKDNLTGKFNVELLRRIDNCKDFILLVFPNTFDDCDSNIDTADFYRELTALPIEQLINTIEQLEQLPKTELAKKINWTGDIQSARIDYLRIEINRALHLANKGQLNIIPLTFLRSEKYSFSALELPNDLKPLKNFQAVFYSDSEEERFNRIIPDLKRRLVSTPNTTLWKSTLIIILLIGICISGYFIYTELLHVSLIKSEFEKCKTYSDYETFLAKYPDSKLSQQCSDSILLFHRLENEGKAYVNNAGTGYMNENIKNKNIIDCIEWDPNITLLQLRTVKDILNRMMLISAEDITFDMGKVDTISYDSPVHKVTLTDNYFMCQYEITREWYHAIMNDSIITENQNHPISDITWKEANEFTDKLKHLTRLSFSLPSEAQWEWAATMGTNSIFAGSDDARSVAWYNANSNGNLHEVGTLGPNSNQLYDLSGNVAEWCIDNMSKYKGTQQTNPIILDENSMARIIRGGSILTNRRDLNVRHRAVQNQSESSENVGFRIIMHVK